MGEVLHGCATTTEAIRRAIQNSQESLRVLAKRYGINQKTVAKWKQRETVADLVPTGPKEAKSTVLSVEEEAIIVAFRRHALLPLDDCLYALQPTIPHLTRSSLHRCLPAPRHRAADCRRSKAASLQRKSSGLIRSAISTSISLRSRPLKVSSTSMSPSIALASSPSCNWSRRREGLQLRLSSEALIAAVPYKIHTVLTDNGVQFTFPPRYADGPTARYTTHMFDMRCRENGIEHRLTKIGASMDEWPG